jgi:hypothetical protein
MLRVIKHELNEELRIQGHSFIGSLPAIINGPSYGLFYKNRLVGFITTVGPNNFSPLILNIWVWERRKGLGTLAIGQLEKLMAGKTMRVEVSGPTGAEEFWEAVGFPFICEAWEGDIRIKKIKNLY